MFKNRILWFLSVITICAFTHATTYYVKTDGSDSNTGIDWVNAFQTITKAMGVVSTSDEVWVAAGIYKEGTQIMVPENVTLYGGFVGTEATFSERDIAANQVIIDGNNRHSCLSNSGILDGLYIRNGKADTYGGGIYNKGTVTDCTLYGSNASDYGGGIYNADGQLSGCVIYDNSAKRGGGIFSNAAGIVTDCFISGNSAIKNGGGIYSSGTVTNCVICNNMAGNNGGFTGDCSGGGMMNTSGTVSDCTLYGNNAFGYGGGIHNAGGQLSSCAIYDNSAMSGGGVYNDNSGV